jgi:hypothetical protein
MELRYAFKEWAVVCEALATGRQSLILRKGGIAEENGEFQPEHRRFWLFPTYLHQQAEGLRPEAVARLAVIEADRPAAAVVRLSHFVEVPVVYRAENLEALLRLSPYHVWSEQTVAQRFHYRRPGLFVLPVRVYRADTPIEVPLLPEYEGCKTWVDLGELRTVEGTPVLSNAEFAALTQEIGRVFKGSANGHA